MAKAKKVFECLFTLLVLILHPHLICLATSSRGGRLLQTSTLIGQEIQLSSYCPIRARGLLEGPMSLCGNFM